MIKKCVLFVAFILAAVLGARSLCPVREATRVNEAVPSYQPQMTEEKSAAVEAEPIAVGETATENDSSAAAYVGRFSVPSVGVDVACYDSNSQATVDAADSAAYFFNSGHAIIGDHVNQGFSAIKSCSVGTKAYLTTENGVESYTCVDVIQGHNTGTALTDSEYHSIRDLHPGALVCYTCNGNWQNVTIVFFAPDSADAQTHSCERDGHAWGAVYSGWKPDYLEDGSLRDYVYYENRRCEVCGHEEKNAICDFGIYGAEEVGAAEPVVTE